MSDNETQVVWWRRKGSALVAALVLMSGLLALLLFLLMQATDNRDLFDQYYEPLLWVNTAVAITVLLLVVGLALMLVRRLLQKRFGSRLLLKLAAIFALVGVLPAALVYSVSYQFVTRSIETWFDVRVEGALNAGLNLGRSTFDLMRSDLAERARNAARQISDADRASGSVVLQLSRLKEQLNASQVEIWDVRSSSTDGVSGLGTSLSTTRPAATYFQAAQIEGVVTWITGLEAIEGGDMALASSPTVHALAKVSGSSIFSLVPNERMLQVSVPMPRTVVADALAVQQAYREYQERALGREGLRQMYVGTLTLALILAVFGAFLVAAVLGNQLVKPLLMLAQGVRDVARGDLSPRLAVRTRDEMGDLTRSFVDMTQQLRDAREQREQTVQALDHARASLQAILDNLSAGVMLLDDQGCILLVNPSAVRILGEDVRKDSAVAAQAVPETGEAGAWLSQVQVTFGRWIDEHARPTEGHWQHTFEMARGPQGPQQEVRTLLARGALLSNGSRLLVFDDISDLVSAQRAQAWSEVARRLAHEIKNPLTPIQLSAERLAHRLQGKLEGNDEALLHKSVRTIVDQVDAMKRLVNEFRDFARLPAPKLALLQLNDVVRDSLSLYEHAVVPVRLQVTENLPLISADAEQLRQVLHNLVQNAQDATLESHPNETQAFVQIETAWSESTQRVVLRVLDQGSGFPDFILKRAFEPYVTTKDKGTGLGLAMVKKIADEHHATVRLTNRMDHEVVVGGQVSVSFPTETLA